VARKEESHPKYFIIEVSHLKKIRGRIRPKVWREGLDEKKIRSMQKEKEREKEKVVGSGVLTRGGGVTVKGRQWEGEPCRAANTWGAKFGKDAKTLQTANEGGCGRKEKKIAPRKKKKTH